MSEPFDPVPFSEAELVAAFHETGSINQHLLTLYGLAVGMRARRAVELGLGTSTRALRAALRRTGGVLHTCDLDGERFAHLLEKQDEHWQLHFSSSDAFLDQLEAPVDFALHDAAHDYFQVRADLRRLLPKMSTFGVVAIHDTQQVDLAADMLAAIRDAVASHDVSVTTIPTCNGLTLVRLESGPHPPIEPMGDELPDGRFATRLVRFPAAPTEGGARSETNSSLGRWLRWRLRKIVKGF